MENLPLARNQAHAASPSKASAVPRLSGSLLPAEPEKPDEDESVTIRKEWVVLAPLPSLLEPIFGAPEQRKMFDAQVLTKTKPLERIWGYPKDYLHAETSRLADGFKRVIQQRDQVLLVLEDAFRKRNMLFADLERVYSKTRQRLIEYQRKLHDAEAKAAAARRQAGLAKGQVLKGEEVVARATLAEEEARATQAALEVQLAETLAQSAEAKKRADTAEAVAASASRNLTAAREALKEATLQHQKDEKQLREDFERQVALLTGKLAGAEEQLARVNDLLVGASQSRTALETDLAAARAQVEMFRGQVDALRQRCEATEAQLNARDGSFETVMATMKSNMSFLQERIEAIGKEKARLETRVEELLAEAKAQTQREFEASTASDRLRDKCEQLSAKLMTLEQRNAEHEQRAVANAAALEEARADAARNAVRLVDTKDQHEKALQQAKAEAQRADSLAREAAENAEKAARVEQELAVVKIALDNAQRQATGGPDLSALLEQAKQAEQLTRRDRESSSAATELAKLQKQLQECEARLARAEAMRRHLHDEVQSLRGNIRVVARIRPPSAGVSTGPSEIKLSVDGQSLALDVAGDQLRRAGDKIESHSFAYNRVFGPEATQHDVFEEISTLVQSALDGYNVCLFSYGQTGSGKTFTMMGDQSSPINRGIVPRAVDQILCSIAELRQSGWEYSVEVSYVEIYNEAVRDLLALDFKQERNAKHEIVNNGGDVYAKGVRRVGVSDGDQVHSLLQLAMSNRAVASTDKNHESSRSHSIFSMHLVGRNTRGKTSELVGCLSLCDLAGSERLKSSNAQDERLKETQNINTSLSALSNVFISLAQKAAHVSFRNSALTHLLSPCLSGDGKTLMIVNVSPDHCDASETLCSLRFAQTVNKTEVGRAKKNVREGGVISSGAQQAGGANPTRSRINSMPTQ